MNDITLGVIESRFADLIWQGQPITSTELCKQSEAAFGWKKSTTFTVLKRLCDKGLFKNEKGTVTSLVTREAFYAAQSGKFVEDTFGGSLPAFVAAFASGRPLSPEDVAELRRIIDAYEEG